ncbi:hypothetical protein CAOG_07374 [Capsaspora owczarzaki ATCC 30864]|uniref:Large ribosomal subunit protein bL32m n=1 Tax=Capsaspora owczarzaki (strain ATCC 30864) TaxID=595528 RepID=A0A0D2X5B8_CAPO3|nr:hypothetical protein CAOG_07374 [Capsaspora owczarzaki ATCC 30864]KJE97534.1 hypothetical protein CAOG_007374 [Capsaspora owczarzaki ATCC 30864]|eukprot:XP_004343233.1 hypothetical protein CAOG_07374 [Capsaspora owczarzaki ATCC 30864]
MLLGSNLRRSAVAAAGYSRGSHLAPLPLQISAGAAAAAAAAAAAVSVAAVRGRSSLPQATSTSGPAAAQPVSQDPQATSTSSTPGIAVMAAVAGSLSRRLAQAADRMLASLYLIPAAAEEQGRGPHRLDFALAASSESPLAAEEHERSSLTESVMDVLREGFLWALPKRKTTPARKARRSTHKGLEPVAQITTCMTCGRPKHTHMLCGACFRTTQLPVREFRREELYKHIVTKSRGLKAWIERGYLTAKAKATVAQAAAAAPAPRPTSPSSAKQEGEQ